MKRGFLVPKMATSPTSSCSSSYSSPFSSSKFSQLPVAALRERIVEKILENRVTLIVGETGCGKSSQIPQFLLEEGIEPILCTQPRRFAVIAVARMVAKARNCEIGGEVGYHVGHSRVVTERTKIFFKTAGVLLDEMREKGLNALNYKVIILDEVHERSVESDLVLVCVKQFLLKKNNLRVVLMSATADIQRYKDYFKDIGRGERVEVIAISRSGQRIIFQREMSFLEDVAKILGVSSDSLSKTYCSGPTPDLANADIKPEVHNLIHDLVLHIHDNEPDIEKGILIFLPTYYSLEQQWFLLRPFSSSFKVHILHRSIDTEQALMAMNIWKSHRKVILATNIAESSVTIPKVAYVIDSCRSLQVYWDINRKKDTPELVWVSKSQAEQRRGRTSRTCDGHVYRLVTGSFYSQLQDYECPSIQKLSLRLQVLLLCCAESKAINDPRVLMQKALDPPKREVVEDALNLLIHMRALEKLSVRDRFEPTFYGRLIANFSLSFDASVLILKFGDIGMLREGILLGVLMDTQPLPIVRPFGQELLFAEYTSNFFGGDGGHEAIAGRKEKACVANLSAFHFWQRVFKDKHRLEHLKQLLKFGETKATQNQVLKIEEEWCSFHNLVQSSLHHVSDIYDDILNSIHRFRPKFLVQSDGLPSYYDPYEFEHTCLLKCQSADEDTVTSDDEKHESGSEIMTCIDVPYVATSHFRNNDLAENMATVIKEIRVQYAEEAADNLQTSASNNGFYVNDERAICTFFLRGLCNRGSECMYSHSFANTPACKFFLSLQGCRNGGSCRFSHELGSSSSSYSESSFCFPEDEDADAASFLQSVPTSDDGCIFILDDTDLHFSSKLSRYINPSKIVSTTCLSDATIFDPSVTGIRVMWGLDHPYDTIISKANVLPWNEVKCVIWFPNFDKYGENLDEQRHAMQDFFKYLAVRMLADELYEVQIIVTMNNLRFSKLQVEKLGRDCFFFLTKSFPFDESNLGELPDKVTTKKRSMMASRAISYVFDLHPPTDIQFGDYASVLQKDLHGE